MAQEAASELQAHARMACSGDPGAQTSDVVGGMLAALTVLSAVYNGSEA